MNFITVGYPDHRLHGSASTVLTATAWRWENGKIQPITDSKPLSRLPKKLSRVIRSAKRPAVPNLVEIGSWGSSGEIIIKWLAKRWMNEWIINYNRPVICSLRELSSSLDCVSTVTSLSSCCRSSDSRFLSDVTSSWLSANRVDVSLRRVASSTCIIIIIIIIIKVDWLSEIVRITWDKTEKEARH